MTLVKAATGTCLCLAVASAPGFPVRPVEVVEGVTITSYWTAVEEVYREADPNAPTVEIEVVDDETGETVTMTCIAAFVEEVKREGWGLTLSGDYIGWWDEAFHLGTAPLDSRGNALVPYYTVAVDPQVIPLGAWVAVLPQGGEIPEKLLCRVFYATDTGVTGAWVDIYVGHQYVVDMNETEDAYWIQGTTVIWGDSAEEVKAFLVGCSFPTPTGAVFRVERETGNVLAAGSFYGRCFYTGSADMAEWVPVSEPVEPGDVLEIDPEHPGYYRKARGPCSTLVVGVVSTEPGFVLGHSEETEGGALLALLGIVPVKVTDEGGPIRTGDLLVASSIPGYAMRWDPDSGELCSFVGKALEPFDGDKGVILTLLVNP